MAPMSLKGLTAIVTGASDGIGAVTARELAGAGARVVLAVRNPDKALIAARSWAGATEVRRLDLSSLESVRAFRDAWVGDVDLLVNNAGVMQTELTRTHDGFETHIGVNHLGHFALTLLLLPDITGRIVTVSSDLHRHANLDVDDLNWEPAASGGRGSFDVSCRSSRRTPTAARCRRCTRRRSRSQGRRSSARAASCSYAARLNQ